ncbi:beta-lactamase domain-containing protein 2-like [Pomacea canaliculata]|uniref:beta-lactamase domain-containing protein 2-like n=1 Tax=Pomacea canaliculata TaxID=400727 RepID=UPI000D73B25C|nr:beta-lactamase domain-containing protein 2-like [Pomacea canaliculata]
MARLTATVLQAAVAAVVGVVAWQWYQSSARLPPVSGGFVHPAYQPVADLFRKLVEDGTERGGSFAVYHQGEKLVELWGGYANPHSSLPWQESTVTATFSSTKGMAALSIAKLVERGLLDYKAEIQKYWPEFAQNNKSNITLEMLMSHQAGLLSLGGASTSLAEYQDDWGKVEKLMAQATTDFPPGSAVAYHGLTFAMYIDAIIIRRVDPQHRNLSQFFDEEISKPLDADSISDFLFASSTGPPS